MEALVLVFPQSPNLNPATVEISGLFRRGGVCCSAGPAPGTRKRKSLHGRHQWFGSKGSRKEISQSISGADTELGAIT